MKNTFIIIAVLALFIFGGTWLYKIGLENSIDAEQPTKTYQNESFDLRFMYRAYPEGYIVTEHAGTLPGEPPFTVTVMKKRDWEELQNATEPRDGPPAISVSIFPNTDKKSALEWIQENPHSSLFQADRGYEVKEINGNPAIAYPTSGLYEMDSVVIVNELYVYMFSGSYISSTDPMREDFQNLVNTVQTTSYPE